MDAQHSARRVSPWPVYLAFALLTAFALILAFEFTELNRGRSQGENEGLTAETYMERVTALLVGADPQNGSYLIDQYECGACHRKAAGRIAPSFVGIAERAASRRPPLTAAAYIYESITNPGAYVVDGYGDAMLKNYHERLPDRELGDIIAYLLSGSAE